MLAMSSLNANAVDKPWQACAVLNYITLHVCDLSVDNIFNIIQFNPKTFRLQLLTKRSSYSEQVQQHLFA